MLAGMAETNDELVTINLRIPEELRTALKVAAALHGQTMNELGTEILEKGLAEKPKDS
jgi:plasmid stability protein